MSKIYPFNCYFNKFIVILCKFWFLVFFVAMVFTLKECVEVEVQPQYSAISLTCRKNKHLGLSIHD